MTDPATPAVPQEVAILTTIRHIIKNSDAPYKTAHVCIEFVNHLLNQLAQKEIQEKSNGERVAQGSSQEAQKLAGELELERLS